MRKLSQFIQGIEKFNWKTVFTIFIASAFLRAFLEGLLERNHIIEYRLPYYLHHLLFFLLVGLVTARIISLLLPEKKENILKVVLSFMPVIVIPPVIDFVITIGKGYHLLYIFNPDDIFKVFISYYTKPFSYTSGVSPGIKIEVWIISFLSALYLFIKRKNFILSFLWFFFFPLIPLLIGSIFSSPLIRNALAFSWLTTIPVMAPNAVLLDLSLLISLTFLNRFKIPLKFELFLPPFCTLLAIIIVYFRIYPFVPEIFTQPFDYINAFHLVLSSYLFTLGVFFKDYKKSEISILLFSLSIIYAGIVKTESFFIMVVLFLVALNIGKVKGFMHAKIFIYSIFSIILGISYFSIDGHIPLGSPEDEGRRFQGTIYSYRGKSGRAIVSFSKINQLKQKDTERMVESLFKIGRDDMVLNVIQDYEIKTEHHLISPSVYRNLNIWRMRIMKDKGVSDALNYALLLRNTNIFSENLIEDIFEILVERGLVGKARKELKFMHFYGYHRTHPNSYYYFKGLLSKKEGFIGEAEDFLNYALESGETSFKVIVELAEIYMETEPFPTVDSVFRFYKQGIPYLHTRRDSVLYWTKFSNFFKNLGDIEIADSLKNLAEELVPDFRF